VGEYLVDNHGIFDTGDNPNSTTTLGAGFYVDIEYPLQALRSDYCHPGLIAGLVTRFHGRVVKILMRLPDGNTSAAHPNVLYNRLIRQHASLF